MQDRFSHLHVHSHYSLLRGTTSPEKLADIAYRQGAHALALTDLGVLHGVVPFVDACIEREIKPIIGCELTVDGDPIILLAETNAGYSNLCKLSTYASMNQSSVGPDVLARHDQGIIALFRGGAEAQLWSRDDESVRMAAETYRDIFGPERLAFALFEDGTDGPTQMNRTLIDLSRKWNIDVVATNDVYYGTPEDTRLAGILKAIRSGRPLQSSAQIGTEKSTYLKSPEEMARLFRDVPEALSNTVRIADRCAVDLQSRDVKIPVFNPQSDTSSHHQLRQLVMSGAKKRYGDDLTSDVRQRVDHELNIISSMGFSDYFLIVADMVAFAKSRRIPVGPGRGSSASSIVAYTLGITEIDPLQHGLFFERFLNPQRKTMPDIDIDLCQKRRGDVIDYVKKRYGEERVSHIGTFGTLTARAAVREVGRLLHLPGTTIDEIASAIPSGPGVTLDQAIRSERHLQQLLNADATCRQLETYARLIEGLPRHLSTHAAGIVVTQSAIDEHIPLCTSPDGTVVTQFVGDDLERLGFLKIDLLGLRTLTAIDQTVESIFEHMGETIVLDRLQPKDPQVFHMLSKGLSEAVFQLETPMFQRLLTQMRPSQFDDLTALLALGRPGPMMRVEHFLRMRRGERADEKSHPILQDLLAETYGIMLYQEQVMVVASEIAGYSMGEADLLRRAMTKKDERLMEEERARFVERATRRGVDTHDADVVFSEISQFAAYGFPKSHSAAYATLTYRTAYLKAHYPSHYMAAQINTTIHSPARVSRYVAECKRLGLHVRGPDVNLSEARFSVDGDSILYGLAALPYVGHRLAEHIVNNRLDGPYTSVQDFVARQSSRTPLKSATLSLVESGAFDSLYSHRQDVLNEYNRLQFGTGPHEDDPGQIDLFSTDSEESYRKDQLKTFQILLSHFKIPDDPYKSSLMTGEGAAYTICGHVGRITRGKGKGDIRSFILADTDGREVSVLIEDLNALKRPVEEGALIAVKGRLNFEGDKAQMVAEMVKIPTSPPIILTISDGAELEQYAEKIKQSPGSRPVVIKLEGAKVKVEVALSMDHWVHGEAIGR